MALSDEQGQVVAEWVRDPFGNVVSKRGTVEDNHMFPGQFWDADAQLAYNWNRWYSPEIGRYAEVDIVTAGVQRAFPQRPELAHTYSYALNNPVLFSDAYGLLPGWGLDCPKPMKAVMDGGCVANCIAANAPWALLGVTACVGIGFVALPVGVGLTMLCAGNLQAIALACRQECTKCVCTVTSKECCGLK